MRSGEEAMEAVAWQCAAQCVCVCVCCGVGVHPSAAATHTNKAPYFFFFFFFVSFLLRYWPYGKSLEGLRVHRIASGRNHMAFIVGTPFLASGNGGSNEGKSGGGGQDIQEGGQGTSTSAAVREGKGVLAHTVSIGTP